MDVRTPRFVPSPSHSRNRAEELLVGIQLAEPDGGGSIARWGRRPRRHPRSTRPMETLGREPAEKTPVGVGGIKVMLTVYVTVYDSLLPWYGTESKARKPRRNGHFSESRMGGNGFRDCTSFSSQLDLIRYHCYRVVYLRSLMGPAAGRATRTTRITIGIISIKGPLAATGARTPPGRR